MSAVIRAQIAMLTGLLLTGLLLAGCGVDIGGDDTDGAAGKSSLDEAAIAAGVVVDPASLNLEGLYERDSGLGTDRFCAIQQSDGDYRVGLIAVFGAGSQCEGVGTASMDAGAVTLTLRNQDDDECEIAARFDGASLAIAGSIDAACDALCSPRASLAGVAIPLVDGTASAAENAVGREIAQLCQD